MNIFYLSQTFPLSDEIWEDLGSPFEVSFLKEKYFVDIKEKKIIAKNHNINIPTTFYPILINYQKKKEHFINIPPSEFVAVEFRKDWGLFFRGVHSLKEELVLESIKSLSQFDYIFNKLNARKADKGDSSYILEPLEHFYLMYIYWEGDEEFPPSLKILFDRKLASFFMQDIIWGVIVETNYRIKIHENYFSVFS